MRRKEFISPLLLLFTPFCGFHSFPVFFHFVLAGALQFRAQLFVVVSVCIPSQMGVGCSDKWSHKRTKSNSHLDHYVRTYISCKRISSKWISGVSVRRLFAEAYFEQGRRWLDETRTDEEKHAAFWQARGCEAFKLFDSSAMSPILSSRWIASQGRATARVAKFQHSSLPALFQRMVNSWALVASLMVRARTLANADVRQSMC